MQETALAPKMFSAYAANKCVIGYGIVNGLVNAGVFAAMHAADTSVTFALGDIAFELALTGALLGVILFACVVPLTRHDLKAGRFAAPAAATLPGFMRAVPRSYAGAMLVLGAASACMAALAGCLVAAVMGAMGALPLAFAPMMVLKGCACALVGACAGYLTIAYVARG